MDPVGEATVTGRIRDDGVGLDGTTESRIGGVVVVIVGVDLKQGNSIRKLKQTRTRFQN